MIGKIVAALLTALFILSNPAFATDWVYLQRLEGTRYGPCTEYFDGDSVVKSGDKIIYWSIWVLDETLRQDGTKKLLFRKEAPLIHPLRNRTLEMYLYDSEDRELRRYVTPGEYYHKDPEGISRVMQYAKTGNGGLTRPAHIVTPAPRWFGFIELEDGNLYWDVSSIVAWPRDNPTTVEMTVKYVWNKEGIERRMAQVKKHKWYRDGFAGLSHTLVNYQFLLAEKKGRTLTEADYNIADERLTLLESYDWHDIAKGSKEEQARRIALKWLNDRESYGE